MRSIDQIISLIKNGCKVKLDAGDYETQNLKLLAESLIEVKETYLELVLFDYSLVEIKSMIELFSKCQVLFTITPMPNILISDLIEISQMNKNIVFDFSISSDDFEE